MSVSEGVTILAAIFNNLLGILSRPVAFFSSIFFNRLGTISTLGDFRENFYGTCSRSFKKFILFKVFKLPHLNCVRVFAVIMSLKCHKY